MKYFLVSFLLLCSLSSSFAGTKRAPDDLGFVKTLNGFGWMATQLDPITEEFLSFSIPSDKPVLDIGTAFGWVPSVLLQRSVKVVANDLDSNHLQFLFDKTSPDLRSFLTLNRDRFPDQLDFESESFRAVLACRLFHFLSGDELELGVRKIYRWLIPGGKVFVFANAPFRRGLLSDYDRRKQLMKYPGTVNLREIQYPQADNLPEFFHFLDREILIKLFTDAGFEIELAEYIDIPLPAEVKLGGQENVGIIARKPLAN